MMDQNIETIAAAAKKNIAAATEKLRAASGDTPDTYWMSATNEIYPGYTYISVPSDGTLWIFYEWSNAQAENIYVLHQGGSTTPINPGENLIPVSTYDLILYQLTDPVNDMIKLIYQMM